MYQLNEGSIDLPSTWKDQSVNIISSEGGANPSLSFTITREDIPWGMEFSEYVASEIEKASDALTDFEIQAQTSITVSGVEAVEIECTWKSNKGPMHQIITTVNGPRALILTASQPGKMSDTQKNEVRRIAATLKLNAAEAG